MPETDENKDLQFFTCDGVEGVQEYALPRFVTNIFQASINDKPTNFDIVLRLKRPIKKNCVISIGVLRKND